MSSLRLKNKHEKKTHTFHKHLRLLYAQMSVDASVSCCTSQVLVLAIRNVLFSPRVSILLGQAKVNNEKLLLGKLVR